MIGLCTDSGSQLPPELIQRFVVEVVPVTISIGGDEFLEGVDLDADEFYERFTQDPRPVVTTSPPSSGQFALAYDELVARGATEIVSIHVGAALSGALNSARLGARQIPVPIRHVDTGTASFGVGCCVWAAGDAIARGADLETVVSIAERTAATVGHVLVPGVPELVRGTGRAAALTDAPGVAVVSLIAGEVHVLSRVAGADEAAAAMARHILDSSAGHSINVAIGVADRQGWRLSLALERLVGVEPTVREIVRYRIGPSIGSRVGPGPGTAGAFFYPVD